MIKAYCDCCTTEIKPGEMTSEFNSLETAAFGGKGRKAGEVYESKYLLCNPCTKKVKETIISLTLKK